MKTIKDAVIELEGKLPAEKEKVNGWTFYNGRLIYLKAVEQPIVFTPEQFEAEAKRMGYINGYLWGKEYPTNGKRPDLPDDVFVSSYFEGEWSKNSHRVDTWSWVKHLSKFRITDPRFKPVDEVSETNLAFAKAGEAAGKLAADMVVAEPSVSHSSIDGIHAGDKISIEGLKRVRTSWFERGELPPAGVECVIGWSGSESRNWYKVVIGYRSERYTVIIYDDGVDCCYSQRELVNAKFRPIKTERENVIEAALDAVIENDGIPLSVVPHINQILERIYDAGMLYFRKIKSDTEDQSYRR